MRAIFSTLNAEVVQVLKKSAGKHYPVAVILKAENYAGQRTL